MRSLFFIPANNHRYFEKAVNLDADLFIFDLEDSIHKDQISSGIDNIRQHVDNFDDKAEKYIRIDRDLFKKCIDETADLDIDGYVIPKFEGVEEIQYIEKNLPDKKCIPLIETVKGFFNMSDVLLKYRNRLAGLAFGAEDYCQDVGCLDKRENLLSAKIRIIEMARYLKIDAYDTIYPYIRDDEGFLNEAVFSSDLGFDGKMIIHPDQLSVLGKYNQEVQQNLIEIVREYEKNLKDGRTVSVINGRIYERNHIKAIKNKLGASVIN